MLISKRHLARRLRCVLAALLYLLATATLMGRQTPALAAPLATLSGTVFDASGQPLGGARVAIEGAGAARILKTDSAGVFSVELPPGAYGLTISANGFESFHEDGLIVSVEGSRTLRFALSNATLQTIGRTVTNRVTSVNRTTASVASVTSQTIVDQGQRQIVNVLDQVPGVEINRDSSNAPAANSSISIRGAEPYESQILIDGHPVASSANGSAGFNGTFINSLLLGDVQIGKGPGNSPNTIENAIGGTLNFQTPKISSGLSGTFLSGYSSFDESYYGLRASDTFGKVGVLIGVAENHTPGYLTPQTMYGGRTSPGVSAGTAFDPRVGVVDFGYQATQDFTSKTQLGKLSYNFSPQTSLALTQYSTQSNNDETGTNYQFVNATIVPCIDSPPAGFVGTPNCLESGGTKQNYTSTPNLGLVGKVLPLNLYAPYPNTSQFDNEPIYSAEFRTVVGSGSLLARYYTGTIDRTITQNYAANGVIPCSSPTCPTGNDLTTNPPTYGSAAYYGEPYVENTIDILHGVDAQYTLPLGANTITAGFDRHVDAATFGAYDPTLGPPSFAQNLAIQSLAYNLRGTFELGPKLSLESANYISNTTYVGTRFDPRAGLVYRVGPSASVRASYGSAYAAPYYSLINPATYVDAGTLVLATGPFKPETSAGYDLGADIKFGRSSLLSFDGYLTNVFNRYASVTVQTPGTYQGSQYTAVTQEGNQAQVREEGLEVQFVHAPRIGLGYHTAIDLLRDYAYNQDPNVGVDSIFSATPDNNVQLPGYPYSKIYSEISYAFKSGARVRFSATSYGQNNAFGEPGFTQFNGAFHVPINGGFDLTLGGTNLFNHDNYRAGGIYDGGPTFPALGGGSSYTTQFFTQPRTLYVQLQRSIGRAGSGR